jgi:hypothetical protein
LAAALSLALLSLELASPKIYSASTPRRPTSNSSALYASGERGFVMFAKRAGPGRRRVRCSLEHGFENRIVIAVQAACEWSLLASTQLAAFDILIGARSRHNSQTGIRPEISFRAETAAVCA